MEGIFPILQTAFGIGLLIFIHELGHYICARMAGVRVEVFSLGFGQRLIGFVRNGTDYRISLVPLGGYVKVLGEDPTQRDFVPEEGLYSKSLGARFWFFSGGVLMNLLFALIAFPLVFRSGVEFIAPVIGSVAQGGPAWEAGLQEDDRILEVRGKETYDYNNLVVELALAGGRPTPLRIQRGDEEFDVVVEPRYSDSLGIYEIGIQPDVADDQIQVSAVAEDSPAAAAGLRDGDRIVSLAGEELVGAAALRALGRQQLPGGRLELTVERGTDGAREQLTYTLGSVLDPTPKVGVSPVVDQVGGLRDHPTVQRLALARGDRILSVDGAPFTGDLEAALASGEAATELRMEVLRAGERRSLRAAIQPSERETLAAAIGLQSPRDSTRIVPAPETPAARAGIEAGDRVTRIDGAQIDTWDDLTEAVQAAGEDPMVIELARGAETVSVTLSAERQQLGDLGFVPQVSTLRELYQREEIGAAVQAGMVASVDLVKSLYVTLKKLLTREVAASNLGGIITISRVSYIHAQGGWASLFYFLAVLSINLAFINVLPIPVLDGGHLMFLLIEKVKGSPVSTRVLNYSQVLGLVFVLALLVFVTYNDIRRIL